jgi:hypothetical protein
MGPAVRLTPFLTAGLGLWLSAALQTSVRLGAPAPDWTVEDAAGRRTQLSQHLRERKREAVVLAPRQGEAPPRPAPEQAEKRLAQREADLLVLPPDAGAAGLERPGVVLVDAGGVVRRIETGKLPDGGELEQFLDQWRLGRDVFLSACARCHGDDGSLEICGDVKPLTGIGNRLTPA